MTLTELAPEWRAAFERIVREDQAEGPTVWDDGSWTLDLPFTLTSPRDVLARLPGEFELVFDEVEELFDHTGGAVDIETESTLWACPAERALLAGVEHWQAGFSGCLSLYPDEASYRAGLDLERQRFERLDEGGME